MRKVLAAILIVLFITGCASNKELVIGEQFAKEKDWDAAISLYKEAFKKDPTNNKIRKRLDQLMESAADEYLERGKKSLSQGKIMLAVEELKKALSFSPAREEIQSSLHQALKEKDAAEHYNIGQRLLKALRKDAAAEEFKKAIELVPNFLLAQEALDSISQEKEDTNDLSLKSTQPITLKFQNAKLKEIFDVLSKSAGINVIFDKDVRDDNVSIFIKDASFKEALNLILNTNNLFMKKINENTIMVIPNTPQKVTQYQDLLIRTFYITQVKAKDMVNLIRTMLETRRVFVNEELNAIVIRDTPDKIKLAEKIIEANDRKPAEVILDVEVIEIAKTKTMKYGWQFNPSSVTGRIKDASSGITLDTLRNISLDSSLILTLPSVIVDFLKQDSDAKTLSHPKIRVLDNKTAKVTIGDRVPILLTSSTSTTASATISGGATTTTSVEFKDVGIKLTADPVIHLNNDVTLKLNLEVTSLGDLVDLGNNVKQFRFGNRNTETVLDIKDGETVIIGGLIRDEDRTTVNKIPGLGDIPIIGKLFSGEEKGKVKTDIILTITPRVVRSADIPEEYAHSFWSGTEQAYSTKPLFAEIPPMELKGAAPMVPMSDEQPVLIPQQQPLVPQLVPPLDPGRPHPQGLSSEGEEMTMTDEFPKTPAVLLSFRPQSPEISVNQETKMDVMIVNARAVSEVSLTITYDPKIVEFKRIVEGNFIKRGSPTSFVTSANTDNGFVNLKITRTKDTEGVSGSGELFSIIFVGKSPGISQLSMTNIQIFDPSKGSLPVNPVESRVMVK